MASDFPPELDRLWEAWLRAIAEHGLFSTQAGAAHDAFRELKRKLYPPK